MMINEIKCDISFGELIDKISILKIKQKNIKDKQKLVSVNKELASLNKSLDETGVPFYEYEFYLRELEEVNQRLWNVEDFLREKEIKNEFDSQFIKNARHVYYTNDKRSKIKSKANNIFGSTIREEKSYTDYNKSDTENVYVNNPESMYNDKFHSRQAELREWELKLAEYIRDRFKVKSMLDFGCSIGTYMEPFVDAECEVKGLELTDKISRKYAQDKVKNHIHHFDLMTPYHHEKTVDLSLSIEVAEHILPEMSYALIDNLCDNSHKYIFFTAAPPGQRGTGHINCRVPEFWIENIKKKGFRLLTDETRLVQHNAWLLKCPKYIVSNIMVFKKMNEPVYRPFATSLGDLWRDLSYYISYSKVIGKRIKLTDWYVGNGSRKPVKNVRKKIEECLPLLEDNHLIEVTDEEATESKTHWKTSVEYDTTLTKTKWSKDKVKKKITYQFDGRDRGSLSEEDSKEILSYFESKGYETVRLGGDCTIEEAVKQMSESFIYLGVDSGFAHVCGSVGTPMLLMKRDFIRQDHWDFMFGGKHYLHPNQIDDVIIEFEKIEMDSAYYENNCINPNRLLTGR